MFCAGARARGSWRIVATYKKPPTGIEPVTSRLQITGESGLGEALGQNEAGDAAHALRAAVEAWLAVCPVELADEIVAEFRQTLWLNQ